MADVTHHIMFTLFTNQTCRSYDIGNNFWQSDSALTEIIDLVIAIR